MFVSEILREAEYKVQVSGTGQSKSFNVVNVQTGAEVSRHRNRATANMAKDRLMPKPLSPADRLKKIANINTIMINNNFIKVFTMELPKLGCLLYLSCILYVLI